MKCNKNFLFISFIYALLNIVDSEIFDNHVGIKFAYIGNKLIYIYTNSDNESIKSYPDGRIIGNYQDFVSYDKDILKIDDSNFLIIGSDSERRICYKKFSIDDNGAQENFSDCLSIESNFITRMKGKYISESQFIIYCVINNNNFMFYSFKTDDSTSRKTETISLSLLRNGQDQSAFSIDCDSYLNEDYFCIYFYKTDNVKYQNGIYTMNYTYENYGNKDDKIYGIMCDEFCRYGNIIKINNIKKKYLICYTKQDLDNNNIKSIFCQYYYYENNKLYSEKSFHALQETQDLKSYPSILLLYENTIFLLYIYKLDTQKQYTRMIIFSEDLAINIHSDLEINDVGSKYDINNLFINSESFTLILESDSQTYIIKKDFQASITDLDITLSRGNSYARDFNFTDKKIVLLDLDENLDIYNGKDIVSMKKELDLSTFSPSSNFFFKSRRNSTGVFYNYIIYVDSFSQNNYYYSFSLISKITVTVCYDSCNDCISGEKGNSTNHLCTSCFNGYFPKDSNNNKKIGFNCYKKDDPLIDNYYEENNTFHLCDISCKTCNRTHCKTCNDSYYFIANDKDEIISEKCHQDLKEKYYLDSEVNIKYNGVINKMVYKECYKNCLSCKGKGNDTHNNCIECINSTNPSYIKYDFSDTQCLIDTNYCLKNNEFWEFKNNNITCTRYNDDLKYIIMYNESKGQIVDDCETFRSPYFINTMYFSLNNCNGSKYCIPFSVCLRGEDNEKIKIDYRKQTCERTRPEECNINFNETDPFWEDKYPYPTYPIPSTILIFQTQVPKDYSNRTEREKEAANREKIWRIFEYNTEINISNFDNIAMRNYSGALNNLNQILGKDIFLIATYKYKNYTINIFPLDVEFENYVYNHIIIPYNLNYINFLEFFTNFWEYETEGNLFLVAMIESNCTNSSINELNYFFYNYNEEDYNFKRIKKTDYETKGNNLEVIYPLKNYKNNNSTINKRNKENLVDNIRSMYRKYPDIELSNIDDPFYNDICTLYTTEVDTDMTLNDRRNEFFVNISLCENNCVLKQVINKDRENVKSICNCDFKTTYSTNTNAGKKDDIPLISSYNIESFVCIKETFKSQSIAKNPIFWILLLIVIFLIIMILAYALYGNDVLKRMFKFGKYERANENSNTEIYNKNSEIKIILNEEKNENIQKEKEKEVFQNKMSDSKLDKNEGSLFKESKIDKKDSIQSNDNINIISNNLNNNNNKIDFSNIDSNKKENPNSFLISDNNINNKEKIEIKKEESSYKNNPPKKKEERKNDSMFTKTNNEDKDLISSDISFSKKYKEENNNSEISFDKISKEKPIYIDNLLNPGKMLENNYLDFPLKYEKNLMFGIYRDALDLNDEENDPEINVALHHYDTNEDNYTPESEENKEKYIKNKKFRKKRNPRVTKLLDGNDLFLNEEKKYESDDNNEKDYNNNKIYNNNKSKEINDENLFNDNLFINNFENKNMTKKRIIKNERKKELIEESKQISENENENSSKKNIKLLGGKNRFIQYLNKKTSKNEEESKYGNENEYRNDRMKTDYNIDAKNMIKSTLKYIGKDGLSSDEEGQSSSFNKNINFKSYNSLLSEKNKFMGKKDIKNNNNEEYNEQKTGKKQILQFQEEENFNGDNLMPNKTINKKKKTKKKRLLKNKKGEKIDVKESEDIDDKMNNLNIEKKSDFDIFYEKALGSSIASFVNIEEDKAIVEENLFKYYWKYLKKRELFIVCFFDKKDTIPYFVRWSCFLFSLIFLFLLNCFFFFESHVHKRYIHALEGENINIAYYFKYEFGITICVSLITIVYKMIVIKIVLYRVFKIKKDTKKMMHHSFEDKIEKKELKNLEQKRYDYLLNYHYKLVIYFSIMIFLSLFFMYICICYGGVFENSLNIFFLGFLFSAIFSFIFCAAICFIIVAINKISRMLKNRCLLSTYVMLSTIY